MSPETLDTSPQVGEVSLGLELRLPLGSAGRRERRAGEGEEEKMNSCKAIKPASLPYCPKQAGNLIQPGASLPSAVWCLPGIQERGCLTAHFVSRAKGALPSHNFQRKDILAGGVSSFLRKTRAECSGSSFITLSCPSSANNRSGVGARK